MHNLIVGKSGSGKTLLAKYLARMMIAKKQEVIVYDPNESPGWPNGIYKTSSPAIFLDKVVKTKNSHVFIDEAKTIWDYDERKADEILYRRRHQGLLIYLIAQRAKMVRPNARNQCTKLFAFAQSLDDARELSGDFNEICGELPKLQKFHFIYTDGFETERFRLEGAFKPHWKAYPVLESTKALPAPAEQKLIELK